MGYPEPSSSTTAKQTYISRLQNVISRLRANRDHLDVFINRIEGNPTSLPAKGDPAPEASNLPALLNALEELSDYYLKSTEHLSSCF